MHQALAVEAQVAREAARVLERLHVLQVRWRCRPPRALVGAPGEQHLREAVHERRPRRACAGRGGWFSRSPVAITMQAMRSERRRSPRRAARHRALDHDHDRQVAAAGAVEARDASIGLVPLATPREEDRVGADPATAFTSASIPGRVESFTRTTTSRRP